EQLGPPQPPEEAPREPYPFWGYGDLALFIGALIPSFATAIGCLALLRKLASTSRPVEGIIFQILFSLLVVGVLYMTVCVRYGKSFAETFRMRGGFGYLFLGPLISIAVGALALRLGAPSVPSPVDMLMAGKRSIVIVGAIVVILGPIVEELIFRGFLQPLFSKTLGSVAGVLISALLFGLLHAPQSQWAWQVILAISAAGAAFGYVRERTGSTVASIAAHVGFNATAFAAYLATH
ncbi:MAG TPA: type II CAAX endopeptidase family protein, partial [Bryobacteraceae bacterium]|nr:type II CAAX endopeptidase family protein [Bryobacteraceae bacterium]